METKSLEVIKRRAVTFSMVLAVVLAAAGIVITSMAVGESECQARADDLLLSILVRPGDNKTVFAVTLDALRQMDLNMRFKRDNATFTREISVLDSKGRLASRGYRLVQERYTVAGGAITWALRYISTQLCGTVPPISMDVVANTDYDTEGRRLVVSMPNASHFFVRETSLSSISASRILTFDDFQNCFPGFRKLSGEDLWDRSSVFVVQQVASRPVVNAHGGIVFHIDIESWTQDRSQNPFLRVVVRCSSTVQQDLAVATFGALKAEYESKGLLLDDLVATDLLEWSGLA